MNTRLRLLVLATAVFVVSAACSGGSSPNMGSAAHDASTTVADDAQASGSTTTEIITPRIASGLRNQYGYEFPAMQVDVPNGPFSDEILADLDELWAGLGVSGVDIGTLNRLGSSGDIRLAWLLADLMRFTGFGETTDALVAGVGVLTESELSEDPVFQRNPWLSITDLLIAWDVPAAPGYVDYKGRLFAIIESGWQPFFDDRDADIDWRLTSWGGVLIDDRAFGDTFPCARGCIPALDNPVVTPASEGDWYPDDRLVFGVVVDGEARAYPKHQMEVHEMINDTLGGRRIGVPYCTLCGSAQAYLTDSVPDEIEIPVLRTTGLLTRSNKVMYDLNTKSILDTFTGRALTGPLREARITLEQITVVTSTWGDWKATYPDTTILAEDGGIGRTYRLDPLGDRDDNGAIFPIGDVDSRLGTQVQVVGVQAPDETAIAFSVPDLEAVLAIDDMVSFGGIVIVRNGGGFSAQLEDGTPVVSHQAFWFAWSQFNPDTLLWVAPDS
ncbi:MAG: DUF3179 domain-containing protein [Acidobacteria bacterium]|nr:DUF3179 domain-containing protein [Acidobacteriota bacterium]MCH8985077.1 DUF3179 domain-containing protein [Acidobacteriota bacterium]